MEILKILNSKSNKAILQTILPIGSNFRGDLRIKGDSHVGGEFEGNIFSDGSVFVDSSANFRGFILANHIVIAGNFQGQLDCKILDLLDKGVLYGDIKVVDLNIEPGGHFFGHSHCDRDKTFQKAISSEVTDILTNLDSLLIEGEK